MEVTGLTPNQWYCITVSEACTITAEDGTGYTQTLATPKKAGQYMVKTISDKLTIDDDDHALVEGPFSGAPGGGSGGGEFDGHLDSSLYVGNGDEPAVAAVCTLTLGDFAQGGSLTDGTTTLTLDAPPGVSAHGSAEYAEGGYARLRGSVTDAEGRELVQVDVGASDNVDSLAGYLNAVSGMDAVMEFSNDGGALKATAVAAGAAGNGLKLSIHTMFEPVAGLEITLSGGADGVYSVAELVSAINAETDFDATAAAGEEENTITLTANTAGKAANTITYTATGCFGSGTTRQGSTTRGKDAVEQTDYKIILNGEDFSAQIAAAAASAEQSAEDAELHANRAETVVQAHAEDTALHLSTQDRTDFNHIRSLFQQSIPEGTVAVPDGAVPDEWFVDYFARNAQPGDATHPRMMVAPGNVFVSRVPYARQKSDGSWENTSCAMDATVYDEDTDIRLLDNSGLRHKCSTDKTENVDSYVGKRWAFFWARCNYKRDAYGVKWVTAVEGETIGLPDGTTAVFDPAKPTGVFGPSIWTFCTPDTGWGTEDDGTPNFQLWGIGDSPWSALSAERKAWLTAHGVDETKYRPWSTGLWYDGEAWQRRSYIVDSAYCGTAEVGSDGSLTGISSKYNEPVAGGLSHNIINTKLGNFGGGGVRACALAMVFDIVKNATKNSQNIHYGMASNSNSGVVSAANTLNAGYVFPIASKGNFEVGCTVYIRTTSVSSAGGTSYVRGVTNQIGRIVAIENRDIEVITSDPTVEPVTSETQNKLCLVLDPATVEPFFARTTTAYATALTDQGTYACAYATQGIALAGETHMVIGKHDGYVSGTNGRHPYRVQGMEMMCGVYQCAADCVAVKGTGSLEIELPDGSTATPTTSQYVYLYAPPNVTHRQSGSLAQYISGGYVPVGIGTTTAGYVYNGAVDPYWGVWYITHTGASDHTGHADNSYMGASPAEFLAGGDLNDGSDAGSAYLYLINALGYSSWALGARD